MVETKESIYLLGAFYRASTRLEAVKRAYIRASATREPPWVLTHLWQEYVLASGLARIAWEKLRRD